MVKLSEVEDKLPLGSFTARVGTDDIDIRQTVGLRQAQASGEARIVAMMRSEAGGLSSRRLSAAKARKFRQCL